MASIFMEVFKPEIDEKIDTAVINDRRINLFAFFQDGDMSLERAAVHAGMTAADFAESMKKAGYKVPQSA